MIAAFLLLVVFGCSVPLLILAARWAHMTTWQKTLVAYQLQLPANLSVDDVTNWLANISAITHPMRFSVVPLPPICLEVVSTADAVRFYVLVSEPAQAKLLGSLRATLPGSRLIEAPTYLDVRRTWNVAAELTMSNYERPLANDRAEYASTALLASLQPIVGDNTEVRLQYIFTGAGTPRPVPTPKFNKQSSASWAWDNLPQEAEAVQAARVKRRDALLVSTIRLGIATENKAQAYALLNRIWNNYHGMNNVGVRLRRRLLSSDIVIERLRTRSYPVTHWPLLLGSKEAAGLLPIPFVGHTLPGIAVGTSRQLPPPANMASRGSIVGASNYPGMAGRMIALKPDDRLRHQFWLAPTGSGKSWVLANQILQDIDAGHGTFVIDPKGDLIADVLARVADKDADRVVVLDASRRDQPIGLNVLGGATDEASRELVVDNILGIFRSIWSDFWGPRSDALCRAALNTLVHARGADGSALTLCELVPLLTNQQFRRFIVNQQGLPENLRIYWQRYDNMSEGERQQNISPLVNKAEAFTSRTPIRLMLGQSHGFDLREMFWHRKAVLVNLAKGTLGSETGNLLGSLLVSLLWQSTLSRITVPAAQRHPCFAYIDEATDLMRLPIPLADMFAQARGLGLGLIVATQLIDQVADSVKAAFLGTVRTQGVFAVEREDAKILEPRFAPLTADDLQGLARFEVALRPCLDGVTRSPVTLTTLPLPEPLRGADELGAVSRQRYGLPRDAVEAALQARITITSEGNSIGRRRREGSA